MSAPLDLSADVSAFFAGLVGEVIDKTWFGVGYSSDEGIRAEVIHGGARFSAKVSNDQMKKLLGQ